MFILHGWALPPLRSWRPGPLGTSACFVVLALVLARWYGWSLWTLLIAALVLAMVASVLVVIALAEGGRTERPIITYLCDRNGIRRRGGGALRAWSRFSHATIVNGTKGCRIHVYPRLWRLGVGGFSIDAGDDPVAAESTRQVIEHRIRDAHSR